ncbi:MAG TPA: hypothetical protein VFX43_03350, partial [Chitinophagaceae bacterium]|nr:hypothetical protein [Chitinophagaceae bacterium]
DNKAGYCWYDVYDADGNKVDSTRTPGITKSIFRVSKFTFLKTFGNGEFTTYLMSGTADLGIMYWESGTSATRDIQDLHCTFNNIPITFKN